MAWRDATPEEVAALTSGRGLQAKPAHDDPDPMQPPDASLGGEVVDRLKELGRGVAAVAGAARHPVDTLVNPVKRRQLLRGVDDSVTLGYGQKLADSLTPGEYKDTLGGMADADQQAEPDYRTGGGLLGMFAPGGVRTAGRAGASAAARVIKGPGLAKSVGRSVLGYEASAPVVAGLHAGSEGRRGEAVASAATDPVGLGLATAAGTAEHVVGRAPERAATSEMGKIRDSVQYGTRVQRLVPRQAEIEAELDQVPKIRSAMASSPAKAQKLVDAHLADIAEADLQPFYDRLVKSGQEMVPVELATRQLEATKAIPNEFADEAQLAVIDNLIERLNAAAAKSDGRISAQKLRETASAYQKQGFANIKNFGQVMMPKEVKQAIGGALRQSVADHVESLADNTESGKALRQAFEDANRRVSNWYAIKAIADEAGKREAGNAVPMGALVGKAMHAITSPIGTVAKAATKIPQAADWTNRTLLAPAVRSAAGQAIAPAAKTAAQTAPLAGPMGGIFEANARAAAKKKQKEQEMPNGR